MSLAYRTRYLCPRPGCEKYHANGSKAQATCEALQRFKVPPANGQRCIEEMAPPYLCPATCPYAKKLWCPDHSPAAVMYCTEEVADGEPPEEDVNA